MSGAAAANATQTLCKHADAARGCAWEGTEAADAGAQAPGPKSRSAEGGCRPASKSHELLCEQGQEQSSLKCEDGDSTRAGGAVVKGKPDSSKAAGAEGAAAQGRSDSSKAADCLVPGTDIENIETGLFGTSKMSEVRTDVDTSVAADAALQERNETVPAALIGDGKKLLARSYVIGKRLDTIDSKSIRQRGDQKACNTYFDSRNMQTTYFASHWCPQIMTH